MVRVEQQSVFVCEICSTVYYRREGAVRCEALPISDFMFSVGDKVPIDSKLIEVSDKFATIVKAYRQVFWPTNGNPRHDNWYKIKLESQPEPYERSFRESSGLFAGSTTKTNLSL